MLEKESVSGYVSAMEMVFNISNKELSEKGHTAKMFMLKYKNNVIQSERIIEILRS